MSLTIWQIDPANLTPYYNLAVCKALTEAGHRVRYITSNYLYNQDLPILNTYQVDYAYFRGLEHQWLLKHSRLRKILRGLRYPLDYYQVLKKIERERPDIIHIQWSRLPRFDQYFVRQIKRLGIPVVHTIHNVKSSFSSEKDIKQLGSVYEQVDKLVLHAEANRQEFLALYPHIPFDKTEVVRFITSIESIPNHAQQANSRSALRHEFAIPEDSFVLLFFGLIRHYKGLPLLLDAFEQAHQANPKLRLIVAGKAETAQDILDVERAQAAKGVWVDQRFIPEAEVWKYFHVSDIAVFPYRSITQSAALLQAMSFGKPIIATDVGAFPESIDNNGWIVPRDNRDALAQAMLDAAASTDLAFKAEKSLEIVRNHHEPSAVARKLTDIYQELLS